MSAAVIGPEILRQAKSQRLVIEGWKGRERSVHARDHCRLTLEEAVHFRIFLCIHNRRKRNTEVGRRAPEICTIAIDQ